MSATVLALIALYHKPRFQGLTPQRTTRAGKDPGFDLSCDSKKTENQGVISFFKDFE